MTLSRGHSVAFPAWSPLEKQPTGKFSDDDLTQSLEPATALSQCRPQPLCSNERIHALREEKETAEKEKKKEKKKQNQIARVMRKLDPIIESGAEG
jgi:hypothetical protein